MLLESLLINDQAQTPYNYLESAQFDHKLSMIILGRTKPTLAAHCSYFNKRKAQEDKKNPEVAIENSGHSSNVKDYVKYWNI